MFETNLQLCISLANIKQRSPELNSKFIRQKRSNQVTCTTGEVTMNSLHQVMNVNSYMLNTVTA